MSNVRNVKPRRSIHNNQNGDITPNVDGEDHRFDETQFGYDDDEIEDDIAGPEVYTDSAGSDYDYDDNGEHRSRSYSRDRFEMSRSCPRTPPRPKLSAKYRSTTPATLRNESMSAASSSATLSGSIPNECLTDPQTNNSLLRMFFIGIALVVLVAAAASAIDYNAKKSEPTKDCSYAKLETAYPEQNPKIWKILRVGIEMILNKRVEDPAVYLFVHHGDGGQRIGNLVKDIAMHTSSCFDKKRQPVEMVHEDFTSAEAKEDYGRAIEKFRAKIRNGNVILIANLNEIPPEAARAFHTICDTHSPIAKDLVIFLTLIIPEHEGNAKVESITEDTLFQLWGSTLQRNELDPLITRVTDQVIALKN